MSIFGFQISGLPPAPRRSKSEYTTGTNTSVIIVELTAPNSHRKYRIGARLTSTNRNATSASKYRDLARKKKSRGYI